MFLKNHMSFAICKIREIEGTYVRYVEIGWTIMEETHFLREACKQGSRSNDREQRKVLFTCLIETRTRHWYTGSKMEIPCLL